MTATVAAVDPDTLVAIARFVIATALLVAADSDTVSSPIGDRR